MKMYDLDRALVDTIMARVALERLPTQTAQSKALDRLLERQQIRQREAVMAKRAEILGH